MYGRSSCCYTSIPHTTPADHRCTTTPSLICPLIRDPVGMPHSTISPRRCPPPLCQHTHGHRHTHYRTVSCTTSPSLPHITSLASALMHLTRTSSSRPNPVAYRPAHVLHSLYTATLPSCPAPSRSAPFPIHTSTTIPLHDAPTPSVPGPPRCPFHPLHVYTAPARSFHSGPHPSLASQPIACPPMPARPSPCHALVLP